MKRSSIVILGLALSGFAAAFQQHLTDDQIRQQIIQQSIASYPGSCPCPYSVARNGSSCGGRSAYSRAGGYQPKCYPKDVSPEDINNFRRRLR